MVETAPGHYNGTYTWQDMLVGSSHATTLTGRSVHRMYMAANFALSMIASVCTLLVAQLLALDFYFSYV